MNTLDRREEFKDVRWQQGRLLLTANTRRWSKEQRDEADDIEQCTAFAFFSASNEGRGREYVFRFGSREGCRAAVEWHNYALETPPPTPAMSGRLETIDLGEPACRRSAR